MASENVSAQERLMQGGGDGAGAKVVIDRYEKGVKALRKEVHNYWLNHAFLSGEQWVWWNKERRTLEELPRDEDRVRATVDRIGPTSRTVISKLISRELRFEVPPSGADDATLQGAYTASAIVESTRVEHDWERLREQAMWAVWKGGTAALAVEWNPRAGKPLGVSEATGREFGTGDTVETVLNIAEFVVQPGVREGEKAQWWIRALALPPEEAQEMYGLDKVPSADATAGMSPTQQKLVSDGSENVDLTMVYTMYERPNKQTPKGRVVVVIGDKVVSKAAWPFPWKEDLNITILRETVVDGKWMGDTVVNRARSVQVAYNASWSSIIEHQKQAGNARLLVPHSSIDIMDELTDLPGELVPYPDGMEQPNYLTPPQMPAWWIEAPDRLAAQLDDILGVHDVSRGEMPKNIESGVGLSILSENDQTPVGRLIQDTARAFGRLATQVLRLYESKVKETREAVVSVPGYPAEKTSWTGADLQDQTRAVVPTDGIVPRSRAAMQAFAQKAMELGLITTFDQFATLADLPDQHSMVEAVAPDVAKARWENHELALGRVTVPDSFDDHYVHIQQHNNFRKSPKYRLLDQAQRDVCDLHVQAHETLSAEAMGRMQSKMAVSPNLAQAADANGSPVSSELPPPPLPGVDGGQPAGGEESPMPNGTPAESSDLPPMM
jgi:hypothetical protein